MQFGNGRWESTQFNSRLQPTQIALGAIQNGNDLLKLDYSYGTTANNGNVLTQQITVPTVGLNTGFTATQTYTYDSLNRINDATESVTPVGGSSSQSWKQAFTYDRYGNRNFDEAETTTLTKACGTSPSFTVCASDRKVENPEILASDNRIKEDQDGDLVNDYDFDSAGNTIKDVQSRKFTYDAENKQIKVETVDGSGNPIATIGEYTYDGDGKRIKKQVPATGETTIFVYDASAKLIGEYSTVVASQSEAKTSYLTTDNLGSPRINTDTNGSVIARHDYHPFGEEIVGAGGRTAGLGYADDDIRKQFTGYERDGETGLDFAEARMLNNTVGRFGTPDPYNIILEKERGEDSRERSKILTVFISNPQRWNLYVYVLNNPLAYTDPDGLQPKTINVFLHLKELSEGGLAEWKKFKADAAKKGVTVNLLTYNDQTATAGAFLESVKDKDTVTVFVGHSLIVQGERIGIEFHASQIVGSGDTQKLGSNTADGVDIQNSIVAIFSCGFGRGFDNISSSNGATFVSIVQGKDQGTMIDSVNGAALLFAQSIASTPSNIFTRAADVKAATTRAQAAMTAFGNAAQNTGDRVKPRILPPPRKK